MPLAAALEIVSAPTLTQIQSGERLSSWLIRNDPKNQAYALGTAWYVPSAIPSQARIKQSLLLQLSDPAITPVAEPVRNHWTAWITQLPVTGRVILPATDPRWLQAHPEKNPILEYNQEIRLTGRPTQVFVLNSNGGFCAIPHRSGFEARAYLSICRPEHANQIDKAWVIQPNGVVQIANTANWNEAVQDEPAPGAMIWAPARSEGWSNIYSDELSKFLATQGPALTAPLLTAKPVDTTLPEKPHSSRDIFVTANDWGLIGLMQTPTARMSAAGDIRLALNRTLPYTRASIIMQPLDWLEGGFRYTDINNRLYGAEIAGTQTYKDKSVDVKIRLTKESAATPQMALGITDLAGTGLFSSEYVVASKRHGNFDWSLGLAWGYLGNGGNVKNPLSSIFGRSFNNRPIVDSAGSFNASAYFHGATSIFGGVQYHIPDKDVLLKVEYDGNNYSNEPLGNNLQHKKLLNLGIVYRYSPNVDLNVGIERGDKLMLGVNFHGSLPNISTAKILDPVRPTVSPFRPIAAPEWEKTAADIERLTKWRVVQISQSNGEIRVELDDAHGYYWKDRIDSMAAVLHRDAPADINRFILTFKEHGVALTERVILRDAWTKDFLQYQLAMEKFEAVAATEPTSSTFSKNLWYNNKGPFSIGLAPSYENSFGGPDGFVLYEIGAAIPAELRLSEQTWITANGNIRLLDNYSKFKYDAPSLLPRVRTYIREYLTTSRFTLPVFQINHFTEPVHNHYINYYAGALESMFAGYGVEWLYRPWHKSVAFGVDLNHVRQRDFHQNFSLLDYQVNTGHATLYWDTGWSSTHINLSAGQYLAGDRGITIDLNRSFLNGVTLGAWATKTNISAATFGEGGFDKGIYLRIPFDAMLPVSSPSRASFTWTPLTRDGGARLNRATALYDLTSARDKRYSRYSGEAATNTELDDDRPLWPGDRSPFDGITQAFSDLGKNASQGKMTDSLALGGAIVVGSSILDRPFAKWADSHQSSRWNSLGRLSNSLTYLLAAGTGVLWLGAGDDIASETAWTAIKSSVLTFGVESIVKFGVGRSRPGDNDGVTHFQPLSRQAASSSFPSFHSGIAFSLVTPFAERYDANWLYAVAGASTFGRIQQRQHFVSDVVAGSLIGYALGGYMLSRQQQSGNHLHVFVGSNKSINASMDF